MFGEEIPFNLLLSSRLPCLEKLLELWRDFNIWKLLLQLVPHIVPLLERQNCNVGTCVLLAFLFFWLLGLAFDCNLVPPGIAARLRHLLLWVGEEGWLLLKGKVKV